MKYICVVCQTFNTGEKIGVVKINWGGLGLDNIFSIFCQIFLDKIKKMLYNKSTLIKYKSVFVNISNRGRAKNAKIKHCKMLHFFATLFLTGVELHLFQQNAARIAKNIAFFAVRKPITTLKIPLRQVVFFLELFRNILEYFGELVDVIIYLYYSI